jgi:mRNA-degrading endonuclease RelE of RelBE toxin-antitoxin system
MEATVYMVGLYAMSIDDATEVVKILARSHKLNQEYDSAAKMYKYAIDPELNVELKLLSVAQQATIKLSME